MPVFKRFKGKKISKTDKNYNRARWIAEGRVNGQYYKEPLRLAKTERDAIAEESLIIADLLQGEYTFRRDKTKFSDFIDSVYLPYAKEKNPSYEVKVFETNALKEYFKQTPLRNITPESCEKYKNWRKIQFRRCQKCAHNKHTKSECEAQPISPSTVNRELTTLSAALTRACYLRKIKDNPMRYVEKMKEPDARERFLSADEKARLFEAIGENRQLKLVVATALLTGWRKGQILSVTKSAMDYETRTVKLIKSKQQKPRFVPVSDAVWLLFERLAHDTPCDYLFYNRKTQSKLADVKKKWNEVLTTAGIRDFHFHDLRRCFATEMVRRGAGDLIVQSALGHSTLRLTGIYARIQNEPLRDSLNAVSDAENLFVFEPSVAIKSPSENSQDLGEIS